MNEDILTADNEFSLILSQLDLYDIVTSEHISDFKVETNQAFSLLWRVSDPTAEKRLKAAKN